MGKAETWKKIMGVLEAREKLMASGAGKASVACIGSVDGKTHVQISTSGHIVHNFITMTLRGGKCTRNSLL